MEWVLIFAIYLMGDRGGVSITDIPFANEEDCRQAGQAMAKEWSRGSVSFADQSRWVCVQRRQK